jgi:aryl-alcohol dehydrogenase-like predicted oxidoreductase
MNWSRRSIDGGINFFDTADNYTEGESEKILGQSMKNLNIRRQDVVIATKVYSLRSFADRGARPKKAWARTTTNRQRNCSGNS